MAILVVIVCLSPVMVIHFQNRSQRELLTRIDLPAVQVTLTPRGPELIRDRLQAMLGVEWMKGYDRIEAIFSSGTQGIDDRLLSEIGNVSDLKRLRMWGKPAISADGLKHLTNLKHLEILQIRETPVTTEGLRSIGQIDSLERLILENSRLTAEGISHLNGLTSLRYLSVRECEINGSGVDVLLSLPTLSELKLGETSMTSTELQRLVRLPKLTRLELQSENITEEAVLKLHAALPDCLLHINGKIYSRTGVVEQPHVSGQWGF